jgi:hypothetical protein
MSIGKMRTGAWETREAREKERRKEKEQCMRKKGRRVEKRIMWKREDHVGGKERRIRKKVGA